MDYDPAASCTTVKLFRKAPAMGAATRLPPIASEKWRVRCFFHSTAWRVLARSSIMNSSLNGLKPIDSLVSQKNELTKNTNSGTKNNEKWKLIEGSLEVKLPTIWTVEKQR